MVDYTIGLAMRGYVQWKSIPLPSDGEAKACHRVRTGVSGLLRTIQSRIRDCMVVECGKDVYIKLYSQVGKATPFSALLLSRNDKQLLETQDIHRVFNLIAVLLLKEFSKTYATG